MLVNPNLLGARLGGLRQWVRGGGFADSGPRQSNPAPSGFTNLEGVVGTGLDILSEVPGAPGVLGRGIRAGTQAANASVMDDHLEAMGFSSGLSFGQQVAAAFGFNSFGTGGPKAQRAAQAMAAKRGGYTSRSIGPNARRGHRAGNQSEGHAASRDPQGHGGGGQLGRDRDSGFGGPR